MHRYRRRKKGYHRFTNSKFTNWEIKKHNANLGDFALARLLVGEKVVVVIHSLLKFSLIVGLILIVLVAFNHQFWWLPTILLFVTFLSFAALVVLSTAGYLYNNLGNIVNDLRKTFRK
jgi:hypothetical protein